MQGNSCGMSSQHGQNGWNQARDNGYHPQAGSFAQTNHVDMHSQFNGQALGCNQYSQGVYNQGSSCQYEDGYNQVVSCQYSADSWSGGSGMSACGGYANY